VPTGAALRDLVRELSLALRQRVLPLLGSHPARARAGADGAGGDVTFAIDAEAEDELERFLRERGAGVAFFSEHRGLVEPRRGGPGRRPDWVLVVDPIDGTRPALAGLESCCVSVAAAPFGRTARMADVTVACVVEIRSGAIFLAERGGGLLEAPGVALSANERLDRMFWAYGFRGRPARPTVEVLAELIDASSVGGATFELGSAAFDMTRVLTGQLDAYVEPGPRMVDDVPGMRDEFERVGGGAVLNNSPYDLAAAALCLEEAGAIVSDAYGRPLGDRALLGSGPEFQISVVASANAALQRRILEAIEAGIGRLGAARSGEGSARSEAEAARPAE
jgi:myo-inositol-1(or 4)-monophosphatase